MNCTVPNHGVPDLGKSEFTITFMKDGRAGKHILTYQQKKRRHSME